MSLYIDTTNPYSGEPTSTEPLFELIDTQSSWNSWRANLVQESLYADNWIRLEEGKSYQMKAITTDYGGASHMTVAVEIRNQNETYEQHPKATRTVTHFAYDPHNTFEEWSFTVKNPDSGSF